MKIGLVKEGFEHTGAESDVEELVRQAASSIQTRLGAKVQEVSIPMHLDGEMCSAESRLSTMHLNPVIKMVLFCPFLFLVAGNQTYITSSLEKSKTKLLDVVHSKPIFSFFSYSRYKRLSYFLCFLYNSC